MWDRLEQIESHYEELNKQIAVPEVAVDPKQLQTLAQERASFESLVSKYREYKATTKALEEARTMLDLKGTRFASADIFSNSGYLFPVVWLMNNGLEPESFFSEHFISGSHDRTVVAVMSGYAEGGAVDSLVDILLPVPVHSLIPSS